MVKNIIIISFVILLSGCTTIRRDLKSARATIGQLEQLNLDEAARNTALEILINAERAGNKELERIITEQQERVDGYIESEKIRTENEKRIIENLSDIFREEADIIEQLKQGYRLIRDYFESQGTVE